jgi:hypothetical protein
MRSFSVSFAIAALPTLMAIQPAAAQNFDDRWSIIPKAHAEPAPPEPDNSPDSQLRGVSAPDSTPFKSFSVVHKAGIPAVDQRECLAAKAGFSARGFVSLLRHHDIARDFQILASSH